MVKMAIYEHTNYNTAELNRSCPVRERTARTRRVGKHVMINIHTMVASFVSKARDVRQMADAQNGEGVSDIVEFRAQVSRHKATEKAGRIHAGSIFQTPSDG